MAASSYYQPIGAAPRDGSWIRLYARHLRITSHTVRWWRGRKGPGWYNVAGERLKADVFDAWFPPRPATPAWCKVLGVSRTANRDEIVAAYRELAKVAHPDAGGTHEVMTALVRARDDALAAITSR